MIKLRFHFDHDRRASITSTPAGSSTTVAVKATGVSWLSFNPNGGSVAAGGAAPSR